MSTYTFSHQLIDMRWWLTLRNPDCKVIVDSMSHRELGVAIENAYEGGLSEFVRVYSVAASVDVDAVSDPQIALRVRLRAALGRTYLISTCHTILRVDVTETQVSLLIRVVDELEGKSRITEKGASVRYVLFDRASSLVIDQYQIKELDFAPECTVGQYSFIMEPERYIDRFWQYADCYRPGTEMTPLDGPLAYERRGKFADEYNQYKELI